MYIASGRFLPKFWLAEKFAEQYFLLSTCLKLGNVVIILTFRPQPCLNQTKKLGGKHLPRDKKTGCARLITLIDQVIPPKGFLIGTYWYPHWINVSPNRYGLIDIYYPFPYGATDCSLCIYLNTLQHSSPPPSSMKSFKGSSIVTIGADFQRGMESIIIIIMHQTRYKYDLIACCYLGQSALVGYYMYLQSPSSKLKLGYRFHALLKVCSDRDDAVPLNLQAFLMQSSVRGPVARDQSYEERTKPLE